MLLRGEKIREGDSPVQNLLAEREHVEQNLRTDGIEIGGAARKKILLAAGVAAVLLNLVAPEPAIVPHRIKVMIGVGAQTIRVMRDTLRQLVLPANHQSNIT